MSRKSHRDTGSRAHIRHAAGHIGIKTGKQLPYLNPGFQVSADKQGVPTSAEPIPRRKLRREADHHIENIK